MANPVINRLEKRRYAPDASAITFDDIIVKTGITLAVLISTAVATFIGIGTGVVSPAIALLGGLVGLVLVLIASFRRGGANAGLVLGYAVAEGLFVGGISYIFGNYSIANGGEANSFQIISSAIVGTIGVFIGMLTIYATRILRVTPGFAKFVIGATFGILAIVLVNLVFALFGIDLGIRSGGWLSVVFSFIAIAVAALNLALDFNFAERAVRNGAPAKIAWDIALGLVVTIVWLYVEMLRVMNYFRS